MISGKGSCFGAGSGSETEETLLAEEGGEGLVGHAFSVADCTDSDATSNLDKAQYLVKGTTTKGTTTKTDSCGTVCLVASCKGQILNPTKLYEYTCGNSGIISTQTVDCKTIGADYKCVDGACQKVAATCQAGLTGQKKCETYDAGKTYTFFNEYQDASCAKTWQPTPCPAGATCDSNKGCCVPSTSLTCKDNKVYSTTLNPCTGQSSDVLKDDCVAKKGTCPNGQNSQNVTCMCTPGYTGKTSCQTTGNNYYNFYKEKVNVDCSVTDQVYDYCGYGGSSCDPVKGCCKKVSISTSCEGDKIHNVTQNSCTGQNTDLYTDCSLTKSYYTGESLTCVSNVYGNNGKNDCYLTSCTLGAEAYYCDLYSAKYYKMTCKNQWQGYNSWSPVYPSVTASSCPPGATCYNANGKCQ
jgi:hypothetical protein